MSNTRSGRNIKKVGVTTEKVGALEQIARLRKGEGKRTDQYDADAGNKQIFEEMDDEEYDKLQDQRRDNFIVGDDDGYKDYGGEIWEAGNDEEEDEYQKDNAKNTTLKNFMSSKPRNAASQIKKPTAKQTISNEESSKVMSNLFKRYENDDNNDENQEQSAAWDSNVNNNFNMEDQIDQMYNMNIPKTAEEIEAEQAIQRQEEELKNMETKVEYEPKTEIKPTRGQQKDLKDNESGNINATKSVMKPHAYQQDVEMEEDNKAAIGITPSKVPKPKLPLNADGSIDVFWLDAHEEFNNSSEVYIFGKIFAPEQNQYYSICLTVQNIDRVMYFVPRKDVEITEVIDEVKDLFNSRYSNIKKWKTRVVKKKY